MNLDAVSQSVLLGSQAINALTQTLSNATKITMPNMTLTVGTAIVSNLAVTTSNISTLNVTTLNATTVNATTVNATTVNATTVNATTIGVQNLTATTETVTTINATSFFVLSSTFMIHSRVALTNNAGGSTVTITNAPHSGAPAKWIAIDDNGVSRFIPTW